MQEPKRSDPTTPTTQNEAAKVIVERFHEMSQRLTHMSAAMSSLRDRMSKMAELAGRVNAAFIMMVGLPRFMRSDLLHTLGGGGGGGGFGGKFGGKSSFDAEDSVKKFGTIEQKLALAAQQKENIAERKALYEAKKADREKEAAEAGPAIKEAVETFAAKMANSSLGIPPLGEPTKASAGIAAYQQSSLPGILGAAASNPAVLKRSLEQIQEAFQSFAAVEGQLDALDAAGLKDKFLKVAEALTAFESVGNKKSFKGFRAAVNDLHETMAAKKTDPEGSSYASASISDRLTAATAIPTAQAFVQEHMPSLGAAVQSLVGFTENPDILGSYSATKGIRVNPQKFGERLQKSSYKGMRELVGTLAHEGYHATYGDLKTYKDNPFPEEMAASEADFEARVAYEKTHGGLGGKIKNIPGIRRLRKTWFMGKEAERVQASSNYPNAQGSYGKTLWQAFSGQSFADIHQGKEAAPGIIKQLAKADWGGMWKRYAAPAFTATLGKAWGATKMGGSAAMAWWNAPDATGVARRDRWKEATSRLGQRAANIAVGGLGTGAAIASTGASDAFATLLGSFRLLASSVARLLIPTIMGWAAKIQEIAANFSNMSEEQKANLQGWVEFGAKSLLVVGAFSMLARVVNAVTPLLSGIGTLFQMMGPLLGSFGSYLGPAALGVGALMAASVLFAKWIKDKLDKEGDKLQEIEKNRYSKMDEKAKGDTRLQNALAIQNPQEREAALLALEKEYGAAETAARKAAASGTAKLARANSAGRQLGASGGVAEREMTSQEAHEKRVAVTRARQDIAWEEGMKEEGYTPEQIAAERKKLGMSQSALVGINRKSIESVKYPEEQGALASLLNMFKAQKPGDKKEAFAMTQVTKGTAQYSSLEEAYKNLSLDIQNTDPLKMKEATEAMKNLNETLKANNAILAAQQAPEVKVNVNQQQAGGMKVRP